MCKEDHREESSQGEKIWSIPSLTDYLISAFDLVRVTDKVEFTWMSVDCLSLY